MARFGILGCWSAGARPEFRPDSGGCFTGLKNMASAGCVRSVSCVGAGVDAAGLQGVGKLVPEALETYGSGVVRFWLWFGSILVSVWFAFGYGLVCVWLRFGFRAVGMVPGPGRVAPLAIRDGEAGRDGMKRRPVHGVRPPG